VIRNGFILVILALLFSCGEQKTQADLILHNAVIYSVDSSFTLYEAMAVKDGRIIALGKSHTILKNYRAPVVEDAKGNTVFPGFIDAHCHFVGYGLGLKNVNLLGTGSFSEVVERITSAVRTDPKDTSWIIGRGWDQNDWPSKRLPSKEKLDSLFPHRPVMLTRIDGHAVLVNSEALRLAGVTFTTQVQGGEIIRSGTALSGVLVDNAVNLVTSVIPAPGKQRTEDALLSAQINCLAKGLTTVDDAGLMKKDVDLIDNMQKEGKLKIRVYAMLSDSAPNYAYYLNKGPYKTDRLNVRSFKFYADGALGSRGACLFKDYSDKPGWKGFLLTSMKHFEKYADIMDKKGFQMNTHCIGDSALNMVMDIYIRHCNEKPAHRWRIEHAQVLTNDDFKNFSSDIIPSVQPTHATSDMYWAAGRLGKERMKNAYAYKELLNAAGLIALGTDFPVEDISPFKTFYAAVARQDSSGFPKEGFQMENALSRQESLKGMTIWAAYANFEDREKGSLEAGKLADFIILDKDIMRCPIKQVLHANVLATYINGEKVFSAK